MILTIFLWLRIDTLLLTYPIHALIKEYTNAVVGEEWNMLARGEQSPRAHDLLKKIWITYTSYEPKTENEKIFFAESVRKLNELGELRRLRLMDSQTGIHPILWFILLVGGITTIIFTFFFGVENLTAQILMAAMLALVIALILFTVFVFYSDIMKFGIADKAMKLFKR